MLLMSSPNKNSVNILAIESSCDDTAAAVFANDKLKSNVTYTQKIHAKYGGVVPELASRRHHVKILPVIKEALAKARVDKKELDAIAVTRGPGLLGSLLVGVSMAKSMAAALDIPLIAVNHMQAHILAHFIELPAPSFPFLCLTVSGGHTQIVLVRDYLDMEVLGTTIDDAAGEAFDKAGKMMGLPYPAGPFIDQNAQNGIPVFTFSKPKVEGLNFSFSGLKTSILYFLKKMIKEDQDFVQKNLNDLCASIQKTIIEILIEKIRIASDELGIKEIAIAGGVSANSGLREAIKVKAAEKSWNIYIPKLEYCTDNAAMIGMAAYYKYLVREFASLDLSPEPRMKF